MASQGIEDDAPDYYAVLGIADDSDAATIKRAWRELARKYHPDAQHGRSDADRKSAEDSMKKVNEAYSVLGDEKKRATYDSYRNATKTRTQFPHDGAYHDDFGWDGTASQLDWNDILAQMFGNQQMADGFGGGQWTQAASGTYRPRDVEASVSIPLETALRGGNVLLTTSSGKRMSVDIKPGTKQGTRLRFVGQGQTNGNETSNLIVTVMLAIPDRVSIDGNDVISHVDVPFYVAMLGGNVPASLPNGENISLKVSPGTQCGRRFVIRGKGFSGGDIVLTTDITVPNEVSPHAKELLSELSKEIRG